MRTIDRWLVAFALFAFATACERDRHASSRELAERATRDYQLAMTDFETDRFDAAIKGFRKVIAADPANAAAHFQLATILADHEKKYVEALAHLKIYLLLRPRADKVPVAETLAKRCEALFAADAVARAGVESQLAKELEAVKKERYELAKKLAESDVALAAAQKANVTLTQELALKKRIFENAIGKDDESSAPSLGKAMERDKALLAETEDTGPSRLHPSDADLLDEEASEPALKASEIKELKALIDAEDAVDMANPAAQKVVADKKNDAGGNPFFGNKEKKTSGPERPKTYVVQPGDNPMSIAKRFYGSKSKWRDLQRANPFKISPDGRVNAGETLTLP